MVRAEEWGEGPHSRGGARNAPSPFCITSAILGRCSTAIVPSGSWEESWLNQVEIYF